MKANIIGDPQDKELISRLKIGHERKTDFLEWLFEKSGHCDHISLSEAWEEFEIYESKLDGINER